MTPCWYCGKPAKENEHRTPRSRGGDDRPLNMVPACKTCNSRKGTRTVEEYRALLGGVVFYGETHDVLFAPGQFRRRGKHIEKCVVCNARSAPVRKLTLFPWDMYSLGWRRTSRPADSGDRGSWACVECVEAGWPVIDTPEYMTYPPKDDHPGFDVEKPIVLDDE